MTGAAQENARMLASILGVDEDEASHRLNSTVLLTVADDGVSAAWADEIQSLLSRTVSVVREPNARCRMELVVGRAEPRTDLTHVHAAIDAEGATIDRFPVKRGGKAPHPLLAAIAACPTAAATLATAIDATGLPPVSFPVVIRFDQLGLPPGTLDATIDLTGAVLIGAGAVGHGFLRALRHVSVKGVLPVIDPKKVGAGNPNRCLYLTDADVRSEKAGALTRNAQPDFPGLRLQPFVEEFSTFVKREGPQRTVLVTVDSRRVRRSIQREVPRRVLDASTTDIRAVVVHSHVQPTAYACLACIYKHVPEENVREQAIADGLGITLAMVKESLISAFAAARIRAVHPNLSEADLVGMAYDSLFKQLCAEQALKTPEGRQVLAPFAFVSSLAGALLVVELLRSEAGITPTNYWQADPWGAPMHRLRRLRPRESDCEFCSKPHFLAVADKLWGKPSLASRSM
ncbi:ThiF family adenylyltransferase [Methylobacterium sp. E-005]|uniref:ThiF family adenylyltransferase n=1 Tax=Methylobacterium sp. E-005 TaxID=2836549 RepID=UPI001FB9AA6C|nr:ThiF family adenylyltransferase [Methylobacterium sp. E-005]MCJ2086725.1 ThiF family adenylyltransferase [Methylobacterium sp. E-005]